jgi:uncharacterized protein
VVSYLTMRLTLEADSDILTVRRYGGGEIVVGEQRVAAPCILSASRLISDWKAGSAAALDPEALAPALALAPRVLLIGVAEGAAPPPATLRRALEGRGIACESMELGAACRTYNVLAQERREVVAVLFP